MTQPQIVRALGILIALLAAMSSPSSAQMFVPTGRDTLRGLPGVEVVVEELQPEVARNGMTRAGIRAEVAGRLRSSGIPVYASQGENPSPAKPYLYVHINALELMGEEAFAVALKVQLRQTVSSVASESQVVNAMTWDVHNVLSVPTSGFDSLRTEIYAYVDMFISDWLAVH